MHLISLYNIYTVITYIYLSNYLVVYANYVQRPYCTSSTKCPNDFYWRHTKCINLTNSLTHILLWYISVTVFGAGGGAGKS